jgi:hypothetical protein
MYRSASSTSTCRYQQQKQGTEWYKERMEERDGMVEADAATAGQTFRWHTRLGADQHRRLQAL